MHNLTYDSLSLPPDRLLANPLMLVKALEAFFIVSGSEAEASNGH